MRRRRAAKAKEDGKGRGVEQMRRRTVEKKERSGGIGEE